MKRRSQPSPAAETATDLLKDYRARRLQFRVFNDYDKVMGRMRPRTAANIANLSESLKSIAIRLLNIADRGFFLLHVSELKIDYLAEALIHAIKAKNPLSLANNTRALVEHMAALVALLKELESLGVGRAAASSNVAAFDEGMGRCIHSLYRAAAQPKMAGWGANLSKARTRPGLVIIPTEDHFTGGEALARRTAERAGARVTVLDGLSHWWMCQDPKRGAEAIRTFVAGLAE